MEFKVKESTKISGVSVAESYTGGRNEVILYDRRGALVHMQLFEGVYYNCFYDPVNLAQIKNLKIRPDDVFMIGFPRTGTHWTYEMMHMLLHQNAETVPFWKGTIQPELSAPGVLEGMSSPRIVHSHLNLMHCPQQLKELKNKIVITLRDPRDVVLSLHRLYSDMDFKGHFTDFLYMFLDGKVDCNGIIEHTLECEHFLKDNPDIPFHVVWYEQTLQDPVGGVQKLSDFLGLPRNDYLCQAIADKCEFKQLAKDKEKYTMTVDGKNCLFNKGVSGRWREHFTDEMLDDYYRVYEDKMTGSIFYRKEYARPT